ncbi:YopT-type cysteine protease domain-containing protein [Photorhabdus noenieputensis]|uniref:YopT-type cysteine protease domain-containing protein n=1 Tax=Photorhabdus noenieputensis TaxID=1208607 RepID=UPI001BD6A035|nr:YopT-type cysteine protease domain-containing protein [Photorhabdus noenieputensis]MBS9436577.1 YopT-type cysteine protease domain-containing protein [Photorhabdus noenieputensis]MCK3668463.1 YopT-type cysteine protease domain-containing protein [Photorhabdus noenieputensis]
MSPISGINHQRIFPSQQLDTTAVNQPQGELSGKSLKVSSPRPGLLERLSATIQRNLPGHSMLDRQLTTDGKKNQESRFSFSMIKDRIVHFAVSTKLGSVRDSASKHGGEVTFKFAQTKGTFLDQIMKHQDTSGGVCESISAHWISAHAKGESVFDQLYVGGQKGQFHIDSLVSIKQLQMDGLDPYAKQSQITESWLRENGIQPRSPLEVSGETGSKGTKDLLNAILDTGDKGSGYKKISFEGQMAGHTVAAYVDDQKGVTFFDPNFGEFNFPDKTSFSNWFSQDFWSKSMYNKEIGLGQNFYVSNFEPKTR